MRWDTKKKPESSLLEEIKVLRGQVAELEKSGSERKKAEEQLLIKTAELEELLKTAPDALIFADLERRITKVNPAFERLYGYSAEELYGKKTSILYTDQKDFIEQGKQRYNPEARHMYEPYEMKYRKKNGDIFMGETIGTSVVNEKDEAIGLVASVRDITERKKTEEELRKSEDFSASLLNNSPNPIIVINPDTSVKYVNPALEEQTGFNSEEIVGVKSPYPWWTRETVEKTGGDFKEALKKGAVRLEELFQRKNGEQFYVEITSKPVEENGEFKYYLATWVDITERKRLEDELKESENKLSSMLSSIGDHMSMMDKDLNILWANNIAKRVFGDGIIGKKCYEVYHKRKEPCEPYPCLTLKAFQDGKVREHDTQVIGKDGKTIDFYCTANVALKDEEGKPTAVMEISRDITESKRIEQELKKKVHDLERFHKFAVGRELKMKELKDRVRELEERLRGKS